MAFFRHQTYPLDLLSLFDDLTTNTTTRTPTITKTTRGGSHSNTRRTFSPAFDVHETAAHYILEGELPGLSDKKAVDIEFVDEKTLLVRGRIERGGQNNEDAKGKATERITEVEEEPKSRSPTVTDVEDDDDDEYDSEHHHAKSNTESAGPASLSRTESQSKKRPRPTPPASITQEPKTKYWISERTTGAFSRSFSFPEEVDVDAVKAKLEHGVLRITVPKLERRKRARKVEVN